MRCERGQRNGAYAGGHPAGVETRHGIAPEHVLEVFVQPRLHGTGDPVPGAAKPVEGQCRVRAQVGADVRVGGDEVGHAAVGRLVARGVGEQA